MKTFTDLLQEYQDHLRAINYSTDTIYKGRFNLLSFFRWLDTTFQVRTADQLRQKHLDAWQTHLHGYRTARGLPLRPLSINKQIESSRGLLKFLASRGYVQGSLVNVLSYVKKPILLPTSVLTHAEVKKLMAHIPTSSPDGYRDRALLEMLYTTGLRRKEILGINVADVDFKNRTAIVMGKGSKQRVVPIGKTALRFVETYLLGVRPFLVRDPRETALFLDRYGKRMPTQILAKRLHEHADGLGFKVTVTPHTLRRSCTTELIRGGANIYHVKDLLGHEELDTLKHYTKLTIEDLKKTHEKCHPRERDEVH